KDWTFAGLWSVLYLIFTIWTGFWYLLPGLLLIIDGYITRIIPWKNIRLPERQRSTFEWMLAILSALIITLAIRTFFIEAYKIPTPSMEKTLLVGDYLFVSKLTYGPKLPITPLEIPFMPNLLPNGKLTYSTRLKFPYNRLKGFSDVQHNDIILFNFPEGDTVVVQYPGQNYYSLLRQYGRDYLHSRFDIVTHPVDKRNNYIKRCVGLPGDTLEIEQGKVIVNKKLLPEYQDQQFKYYVRTSNQRLGDTVLNKIGISSDEISYNPNNSLHILPLSNGDVDYVKNLTEVNSLQRYVEPIVSFRNTEVFPHDVNYLWTTDDFGPVVIPEKQETVKVNIKNIALYQRIIQVYEDNKLEINGEEIYINDTLSRYYTFEMDYYFVLGDNRHNSADSRYWGFVPEDHLVGKAVMTWFSRDPEKSLYEGLRINRMFKTIK
ncbi:MAG: signal peptidase I, partial [bacterium]